MNITISQSISAPPQKVWQYLTESDKIKQWFFEVSIKPEPGYVFHPVGEKDGKKFPITCRVMEAEEDKKISFTWSYDSHPADTLVSFQLTEDNSSTLLTFTHTGFETAGWTGDMSRDNHEEGWKMITANLKKAVEEII